MCLYATTREALIAKRDIRVIKVVKIVNGRYYSPYQECPLQNSVLNKDTVAKVSSSKYIIEHQGIHAYTCNAEATLCRKWLDLCNPYCKYIIINGVIPKGTYYWRNEGAEVAAKYIKFDRSKEVN